MNEWKYIQIYKGMPSLSVELENFSCNRLALITWEDEYAYDEKYKWRNVVHKIPKYSFIQKILAHTLWNPQENIESSWEKVGEYKLSEIVEYISLGLEDDDDIIQQWFGGDDVLKLLQSANNFDEIMIAVRAICGEHETHKEVKLYVEKYTKYYS